MEAQEIIRYIQTASKKTPVKVYLNVTEPIKFKDSKVFGEGNSFVVFGDYESIAPVLEDEAEKIIEIEIETAARYSAVPLLDIKKINARIEPGAIIRDQVSIGNNAVIMMGAIINIGAVIGGRATVGKNCHIGAGAVLAGVIEPASAKPVIVEDGVLVGANAVIVEGVHIGKDAVVAAGAVVLEDVAAGTVVGGIPARVLKISDDQTKENTALIAALREL